MTSPLTPDEWKLLHQTMDRVDASRAKVPVAPPNLERIKHTALETYRSQGIEVESREAAYSSQQCARCGYADAKNRLSQSQFHCRFCNTRVHADVNAARVVRDRRSISASPSTAASRRRLLHAQVAAFQAAHPGVSRASSCRGKPLARGRRDDPRLGNPYFRAVLEAAAKADHPTPTIGVCGV